MYEDQTQDRSGGVAILSVAKTPPKVFGFAQDFLSWAVPERSFEYRESYGLKPVRKNRRLASLR
jgi:hypothetical protein